MAMKSVYILRHAKSSWALPGLSDRDRPLNDRGRRQASAMAGWFANLPEKPEQIVSSSSVRTRETLNLLSEGLGDIPTQFHDDLYLGTLDAYLGHLWAQEAKSVLLVGHNPICDELTRYLTQPSSPAAEKLMSHHFGTCCLAVLEFDDDDWTKLGEASCSLTHFIRPKELETL